MNPKGEGKDFWRHIVGVLFALAFILIVREYIISQAGSNYLAGVVVLTGALLLIAVLSRLTEFSIGPGGVTARLSQLEKVVQKQKEQIAEQQKTIQKIMDDLVQYSMSSPIFTHLCGIACLREYKYWTKDEREWYFLRDSGFIQPQHGNFEEFKNLRDGQNLVDFVKPTPIGWEYVDLRKEEALSFLQESYRANRANVVSDMLKQALGDEYWQKIIS